MPSNQVSELDRAYFLALREHVSLLFEEAAFDANDGPGRQVLDVGPQDHGGIRPYLGAGAHLTTFDIDPESAADVIGDLCLTNPDLTDGQFDVVVCTEVLEHVRNPFRAVAEIARVLKKGGRAYLSAPFNFRIHGPLPDNWRFSEHGWRVLLESFSEVRIDALEAEDRFLAPIHYNVVATL